MEQLKSMKQTLMGVVQGQMGNLGMVNTEELGEAIDMIKDLSEAIYYCTVTEAMEKSDKKTEEIMHYQDMRMTMPDKYRDMDYMRGHMYYSDGQDMGNNGRGRGTNHYDSNYPIEIRDSREGQSPIVRKHYMESKQLHQDKSIQMKELEKYMQELSQDITEMIQDASPEEKKLLQEKLATLSTKIK